MKDYHKIKSLSFRFRPEVIEKLKELASSENRSMSNWMESKIVDEYNKMKGSDLTAKEETKMNEREIYINGELYTGQMLSIDDDNALSKVIDFFEDGNNPVIDGYEVYSQGKFTIKRKV
jgi:uncharacterized protein YacL (UPF0231 family)